MRFGQEAARHAEAIFQQERVHSAGQLRRSPEITALTLPPRWDLPFDVYLERQGLGAEDAENTIDGPIATGYSTDF
jgi:hypothetical protein